MLDYSVMKDFMARYFAAELKSGATRAGRGPGHETGYFDIHRFYGSNMIGPEAVRVRYQKEHFEIQDETIAKFSAAVEKRLRGEHRLYDGPPTMKLVDYNFGEREKEITVQPARYGDQAGTCFALDQPDSLFAPHTTLREFYKAKYPSHAATENPLALCLGVCGILVSTVSDERPMLFVHRSSHLASLERSVGPSAAGSVDYHENYENFGQLIKSSMAAETEEELGLKKSEYKIIPLAFAREIFRGESPQLFCLIETALAVDEISKRIEQIPLQKREFDRYQFIEIDLSEPANRESAIAEINHEAMMNFYLVEEFYQLRNLDS